MVVSELWARAVGGGELRGVCWAQREFLLKVSEVAVAEKKQENGREQEVCLVGVQKIEAETRQRGAKEGHGLGREGRDEKGKKAAEQRKKKEDGTAERKN
ncbi:hypothetical protein CDL15_Pgr005093 [Punica granatum]|uniref:Uncharacterized protein n=1 Tax=Punica granatum TaxID=22663 RepID=A0A218WNV6_PUNGR|nr:hypothetical protein CDL15_Pgr005093 [Punica granatum]